jgi:predicted dehydrogenase
MDAPNLAVIGTGYWGQNLLRNFHSLGVLKVFCDSNPETLATFCSKYSNLKGASSFEEMLSEKALQAVVIATPAVTHYELAKKALLAGKDVFVEKPLALHAREGEELVKLAEERKQILMVGHVLEYHPAVLKIRELISKGTIGKIKYIYSNRLNFGKVRREENILWSFAPHDIAIILRIMGESPIQVSAMGGAYIQANVADVTVTQLLFNHGAMAHFFVSWLNPFKEQRLVIVGSEKMVQFDDVNKSLTIYDFKVDLEKGEPIPVKGGGTSIPYDADEPLLLECKAFMESIRTRKPPLTDGASALKVLHVLQAAQKSLTLQGQPVVLN